MSTGENFKRINHARSETNKRRSDETLKEALTMKTTNKHILALRRELEDYKERAKRWEEAANESENDIKEILVFGNVDTIPELLKIIQVREVDLK